MSRFAGVLAAPHVRALLLTSFLARIPYGINALAIVLFVHERTGSFARAGLVSGAYAAAAGLGLPVVGRAVDRLGQTPVLVAAAGVHGVATAALIGLGLADAPTGVLAAAGALCGVSVPPVSPCLRGLWPDVLSGEEMLRSALALDAIMLEVVFIGAPALTALLVAVASPAVALVVGGAFMVGGTLAFAATPPSRAWRSRGPQGDLLAALRSPGLRTLLVGAIGFGIGLGTLDVSLPAFGVEEGSRSLGGFFVAALALGSALGGVWYGARPPRRVQRAYVLFAIALPVGIAALALPPSATAMLLLAPLAGAALAPLTAVENELVGLVAPQGMLTEAYAWVLTATVGGVSLGTALGGVVIDAAGWRAAIAAGASAGLVATAVTIARRRTLEPRTASAA